MDKRQDRPRNLAKRTHEMLVQMASRDALTGVYNRRELDKKLDELMESKKTFGMILFDLDHFKNVNDTYGHPVGDSLLKEFARILETDIRIGNGDFVARYGGEEFVVVIPEIEMTQLSEKAEKIRSLVEKYSFRTHGGPEKSTVSGGFGIWVNELEKTDFISKIDKALYKAKDNGRNQVVMAEYD